MVVAKAELADEGKWFLGKAGERLGIADLNCATDEQLGMAVLLWDDMNVGDELFEKLCDSLEQTVNAAAAGRADFQRRRNYHRYNRYFRTQPLECRPEPVSQPPRSLPKTRR